jgi:hypothetical protein
MSGRVLQTIRKVSPVSQLLLALLLAVLAARFAWLAAEPWTGEAAQQVKKKVPNRSAQPETRSRAVESVGKSTSYTQSPESSPRPPRSKAAGAAKGGGRFRVHTLLSVKHGAQRSEVFVDGEFMGNTPFAGNVTCVRGEPVSVEIAPRNGPPIHRSVTCQSGPMEVSE